MDIRYLLWLQEIRESSGPVFEAVLDLMGSHTVSFLMMLVPCLVYWCLDKRTGILALFSYGLSSFTNQLVKNTVCCYRPWVRDSRIVPSPTAIKGASGYSFPSGHTQSSSSVLGAVGWANRDRHRWMLVAGLAIAALIGLSRNFLGVHTPQDILVGFAEGCLVVVLAERLLAWINKKPGRDARLVVASLVATAVFLLYVTVKPYPVDYVDGELLVDPFEMTEDCYKVAGCYVGMVLGWFYERRFVDFETGSLGLAEISARMIVGAVILAVAYIPLGEALVAIAGPFAGQFMRHLIAFALAVAAVPAQFGRLGDFLHAHGI